MKLLTLILALAATTITAIAIAAAPPLAAPVEAGICAAEVSALNMSVLPQTPGHDAEPVETRCWKCSDKSSGSCGGGDKHCYGERSDCSKKGCKITGSTSKCSSSKSTC